MIETLVEIETCRLRPGMYVHLDLGWMDHPFPWNRFKIRTEAEVRALHELGLKTVRYCIKRSDVEPLAAPASGIGDAIPEANAQARAEMAAIIEEKRRRSDYLAKYRATIAEARSTLTSSAQVMHRVHGELFARPVASLQAAGSLIDGFIERLPDAADTVLYSINDQAAGVAIYNHSVNVAILSVLLANKLDLAADEVWQIGMGCLFHDIGMTEVPALVRNRGEELTGAERTLMEAHCAFGERIGRDAGLPSGAIDIIMQHHELVDGSGYPQQLEGDRVSPLARLVAIIELYEQFCNSPNPSFSLAPHEAMSQLFVRYRTKLDGKMLQAFIQMMGVYPPGSIVVLSNDTFGKVLSVSPQRPLQPTVMVFDPEIPSEHAVPLNLQAAPEIKIIRAVRSALLPREAFAYLAPPLRAIYFFGSARQLA